MESKEIIQARLAVEKAFKKIAAHEAKHRYTATRGTRDAIAARTSQLTEVWCEAEKVLFELLEK